LKQLRSLHGCCPGILGDGVTEEVRERMYAGVLENGFKLMAKFDGR